jgi:AcrR family transcriptional regulator
MAKKNDDTGHYGGRGDPVRSMELLWGLGPAPRSRGPKQGLTVERIVRAGIEIADADGLAAVSMRRVADRLGVGTMSLYTYVPSKAELVDVMFDRVLGSAPQPEVAGGWREKLSEVARSAWQLYLRHPWLLQVMAMSRPPLGPNSIAGYDYSLRAVDGIGLTELEMDSVVNMVSVYVQGTARASIEATSSAQATGQTDDEWWSAYAPLLEKVFDADKYPVAARVGAIAGETFQSAYDASHGFEFGLARILDGVEVLVRSRQP